METECLLANQHFVRALARSLIADEHLAEDLTQETWLAALRNPPADSGAMGAWLNRVVRNLSCLLLRGDYRRKARERVAARPERIPSTDEILEREVEKLHTVKAVQALKEPYRTTIVLRFYEDLPPREIARHMNVPVETVKTRIQRALALLRKELDQAHGGDGRQWALALIPIAGLKGWASATAAVSAASSGGAVPSAVFSPVPAILKGALAMSIKIKMGFVAAAAAIVIGALYLFWQAEPGGDQYEIMDIPPLVEPSAAEPADADIPGVAVGARETLLPTEDLASMPAAYRKALGGFQGRVVHHGGEPAPGREVELLAIKPLAFVRGMDSILDDRREQPGLATWSTLTGRDGTFHIDCVYPRAYFALRISPGEADAATCIVDAQPNSGETIDLGDIVLDAGAALTGKIVDSAGSPLAGARVRAVRLPARVFTTGLQDLREGGSLLMKEGPHGDEASVLEPPQYLYRLLGLMVDRETMTGPDGAFRMDGVSKGPVTLVADKADFVTCWRGFVAPAAGKALDIGPIPLDSGVAVKGKVVDMHDRPVAKAEVRVGAVFSEEDMGILKPSVFTDERGRFAFEGLPPYSACCAAVRRHASTPWKIMDPFHPDGTETVFRLGDAQELKITALRQGGGAVKDARLMIRERTVQNLLPVGRGGTGDGGGGAPVRRVASSGDGILVAGDLAPGTYEFMVTAPGFSPCPGEVLIKGEPMAMEVILEPGSAALVRVVAEDGQAPLEWAEVLVRKVDREGAPGHGGSHGTRRAGAGAEADGEDWFTDSLDCSRRRTDAGGLARFENLGVGAYRVIVSHPGFSVGSAVFESPVEGETIVAMKPGGVLEGTVLFEYSAQVPPFTIFMEPRDVSGFPEADMPRLALTDEAGRFRVTGLNPGAWQVVVKKRFFRGGASKLLEGLMGDALAEGRTEIVPGETAQLELVLASARPAAFGKVTGRIRIDGRPVNAWITLHGMSSEQTAEAGDDGIYLLDKAPAGECTLYVRIAPGPLGEFGFTMERRTLVAGNQCFTEDFDVATGAIFGRVFLHTNQVPIKGAEVRVSGVSDGSGSGGATGTGTPGYGHTLFNSVNMQAVTDAGGNFRVERVPAGKYSLEWVRNSEIGRTPEELELLSKAVSAVVNVEVLPGGVAGPVALALYPPFRVMGRVVLPQGIGEGGHLFVVYLPANGPPPRTISTVTIEEAGFRHVFKGSRPVFVQRRTGAFEIFGISPGSYKATIVHFPKSGEKVAFKPIPFEVPEDGVTDLVFRPEKEADPTVGE